MDALRKSLDAVSAKEEAPAKAEMPAPTADLVGVINRISGKSYADFFSRYVVDVEVPPYETIFGHAGYKMERTTRRTFDLGLSFDQNGRISRVHPGSSAASAGLYAGDLLLGIDGQPLTQQNGAAIFRSLNEKVGQNLTLRIRRDGDERDLEMKPGSREEVAYRIVDSGSPTSEQLKIR
jgi:predicted metalloprotease with PDZ domain